MEAQATVTKGDCGICSRTMKQEEALFTVECSHTFHFNCTTSYVQHGNRTCPACFAIWNNVPSFQAAPPPPHPVLHSFIPNFDPYNQPFQSLPRCPPFTTLHFQAPSPHMNPFFNPRNSTTSASAIMSFADDEPLANTSSSSTSQPNQQAANTTELTVKVVPEYPALSCSESSSSFPVLVGIKSPSLMSDEHAARPPLDLVAVLDVSGSMTGNKLSLVKEAMQFVIENLGPNDRLSIVSFSYSAQRVTSLSKMTAEGKSYSSRAVHSLQSNGGTNIIDGLKTGIQVLEDRRERNPVVSIMFLSDGQDTQNGGMRGGFIQALRGVQVPPRVPVHTFGFGSDHDAAALHAISEKSIGGTFSFVESVVAVEEAFARCLGGLLSVVAQQTEISLNSATPRVVRINSISSGRYKNKLDEVSGQAGLIQVGDLYADEEKHFLVYLNIPKTDAPSSSMPILSVDCSYVHPISKETVTGQTYTTEILRLVDLSPTDRQVNLEVDRQKNRLMVSEATKQAQEMADMGRLNEARALLREKKNILVQSPSYLSGDALCESLRGQLSEMDERMSSQGGYERDGRGYMLAEMSAQGMQRACTAAPVAQLQCFSGAAPGNFFETERMKSMVDRSSRRTERG